MITLAVDNEPVSFEVTRFPDGTSQVWKLSKDIKNSTGAEITFHWEGNEAEIMHLLMLTDLIHTESKNNIEIYLLIPFLPYARQDKDISSNQTFALQTFISLVNSKNYNIIQTYDPHSNPFGLNNHFKWTPEVFHYHVKRTYNPDVIFYPDTGAYIRYNKHVNEIVLYGEKIRDQSTGKITGYKIHNTEYFNIEDRKILIVDDICDGGATFVEAAKELMKFKPKEIALCVSHGIFSKGFDEMKAAGISQFFTTNSLIKNKEGFKIV